MADPTAFSQAVQQGTSAQPPGQVRTACPADPCQGIGLSNPNNAKEFSGDMKTLQGQWSTLSPADREAALKTAVNRQTSKSGVPTLGITPASLPQGNGGNFSFSTWSINVNQDQLNRNSLSDAEAQTLTNNLYHEARHSEQWYMMAQKKAADGMSAADIQAKTGIQGDAVKSAVANPLAKDSCAYACAGKMDQNVYGADAASRNTKLNTLFTDLGNYNNAVAAQKAAVAAPGATPASIAAANTALQSAATTFSASQRIYASMPEEADAFAAGRLVDSFWPH